MSQRRAVGELRAGVTVRFEGIAGHLDPVGPVRVDHVVDDLEVRPGGVDAVFLVALLVVGLEAVVGDDVSLDADVMPVAQDPLVEVVVNEVALQDDVVGVVELDAVPTVPDFEAFDHDPPDGFLPAVLRLELDAAFAFAVDDRSLAGGVPEDDGLVRLA